MVLTVENSSQVFHLPDIVVRRHLILSDNAVDLIAQFSEDVGVLRERVGGESQEAGGLLIEGSSVRCLYDEGEREQDARCHDRR